MNLNGKQIGAQNVEKLRRYLEVNAGKLPSFNGRLNKSRIATEAGLDRQVFENNPACTALLAQYGDASRQSRLPAVAADSEAMEKIRRLEEEVSKFRDLAAKRAVELEKRRKESAENNTQLRVFETMMETMRNPPLPPKEIS
jgi:hypothetical protein